MRRTIRDVVEAITPGGRPSRPPVTLGPGAHTDVTLWFALAGDRSPP